MAELKNSYYQGSRVFLGLSKATGISIDQVNYVVSQLVCLGLATLFRTYFHPSKTKTALRHALDLIIGISTSYFCFGAYAAHLFFLPALGFILINVCDPKIVQRVVLIASLGYLSVTHLHRQIFNYAESTLDITGPVMVITQKLTSLAFSLHDGLTKKKEDLSESQKLYAVYKRPNFIEFFSYCLSFSTLLAGPGITYNEYTVFINGADKETKVKDTPNPIRTVMTKVLIASNCALVFILLNSNFPISRLKDESFVEDAGMVYKFWYFIMCTTICRFKYYFAWTLADAICNNCGLGFVGYNKKGEEDWSGVTNVNIYKMETGTNLRESIEAWNLGTNRWLRMVLYERVKKYPTLLTYGLSALWHGFYPGYYVTFFSGALFTQAARIARRHIRPYFLLNDMKSFYDVITFITTRFVLAYVAFPFILLELSPALRIYASMYWCFHLSAVILILLVPILFPKTRHDKTSSQNGIAQTLCHVGPITNRVLQHND